MSEQLTRADLKTMTPAAIEQAHNEGRFAALLGAPADEVALIDRATGDLTPVDIRALADIGRHDLIDKAHTEGRISLDTDTEEI